MAQPAVASSIVVGDIRISYLPDGHASFESTAVFPASTPEKWQCYRRWLDGRGRIVLSIGSFCIQTSDRNILVDAGIGPKAEDLPGLGPFTGGRLLESLAQVGLRPHDIDTLVYTHLHMDHVGWTTRRSTTGWILTFARARHLVTDAEWRYWYNRQDPMGPDSEEVQAPLQDRIEFVGDGQFLAPGVTMLSTAGHTPGHASIVVSSGFDRAIILGDAVVCPVQLEEAEWSAINDVDPELGRRTRERLWAELDDPSTVGAGGHFADFSFGRILRGAGKRQWSFSLSL
jgi:glyoxylase-like metal-dependent hydrolase (beta-lactamase superfamily II)